MNKIKIFSIVSVAVLTLSGCNDFLDQVPDNRTVIDSPGAVAELLTSAYPAASYIQFCETMSDNVADKGQQAFYSDRANELMYNWKEYTESGTQDTPAMYWVYCYMAIASANQALASIDEQGDTPEYAALKGEALLCRAYAHFMLANVFGMHYNPNTYEKDLAVPYVTKPETVVFVDYKRLTVKEIYQLVREDLERGLPLISDNTYSKPKWHFTKSAANAFASRFYLYTGEWQLAKEAADKVLGNNPATILRKLNEPVYSQATYYGIEQRYASSEEACNLLIHSTNSLMGGYMFIYRYGFTSDNREEILGARMNKNIQGKELAYKLFGESLALNTPKYKWFIKTEGLNSESGYPFAMTPVLTAEEVLFNRAEACVMLNDYTGALKDLNAFYSKRVADGKPKVLVDNDVTTYYANTAAPTPLFYTLDTKQAAFVNLLLDARRAEFLFEGLRWFDIKRFNIRVTHTPYQKPNEKNILKKDDLRRAVQIPVDAVSYGLEPNPR